MVGAFILASVVAMPATASLQRDAATHVAVAIEAPAPSPARDPCAGRRFFCGRIRIVPADPAERRLWYLRLGAELADAFISSAAQHAIAASRVSSIATRGGIYTTQWHIASGRASDQEQTAFYRLFAGRGGTIGIGGYLLGFALWDAGESAGARALQHLGIHTDDTIVDGTLAHLDGASSWHTSAWLSRDAQLMSRCLAAVAYPGAPSMRSVAGCPNLSVQQKLRH